MNDFEKPPIDITSYTQRPPITPGERYTAGIRHRQADKELPINGSVNTTVALALARKHREDPREHRTDQDQAQPLPLPRIGERELTTPSDMGPIPTLEDDQVTRPAQVVEEPPKQIDETLLPKAGETIAEREQRIQRIVAHQAISN